MIAKLIAHGPDRTAAIARILAALDDVAIEGVETNLAFLKRTIDHPAFRAGQVETGFVDKHKAALLG
jgi:acetyl/propionyl-CoA carboxylase alpha subunit